MPLASFFRWGQQRESLTYARPWRMHSAKRNEKRKVLRVHTCVRVNVSKFKTHHAALSLSLCISMICQRLFDTLIPPSANEAISLLSCLERSFSQHTRISLSHCHCLNRPWQRRDNDYLSTSSAMDHALPSQCSMPYPLTLDERLLP